MSLQPYCAPNPEQLLSQSFHPHKFDVHAMLAISNKASGWLKCVAAAVLTLCAGASAAKAQDAAHHAFARVTVGHEATGPVSGRLLVFAQKAAEQPAKQVDVNEFDPSGSSVAAMEIEDVQPGASIEVDLDQLAFPTAFATMPRGNYELQAVLDIDHSYNYGGRGPQDWESAVVEVKDWQPGVGDEPVLPLNEHPQPGRRAAAVAEAMTEARPGVAEKAELESPLLTKFWGHPTYVRAWVILPPGYKPAAKTTYPTMYWTHGFGGTLDYALVSGLALRKAMAEHKAPPMIAVMLDESVPQGTHEFADSANNGPWGAALTTEFIPRLEAKYRMDARRNGRFLNGHSSGGWATLQLEINYPQIFGGTWSTSPDPSDFHNFTGPDLYATHANVYKKADGAAWPIMRADGKVVATLEQFGRLERVLGPYGGQLASFEWVFSPKGASGAPEQMFDRATGEVNPDVVAYWHDHYDLANLVESNWAKQGALLKGRIHLIVGTSDTFYLDESARLFEARLKKLGADAHFTYIPGRTHFDLYQVGDDRMGLSNQIAAEMYAVARPGVDWKQTEKAPAK